jgi:phage FluMu protein Com
MKFYTVKCVKCNNSRLFDASDDAKGVIEIKCIKCGNIVPIHLDEYLKNNIPMNESKEIHTEQRSII